MNSFHARKPVCNMYPIVFGLRSTVSTTFPADMHRTKLTHTDLKPENILFVSSDFGIFYDARKVCVHVLHLYANL